MKVTCKEFVKELNAQLVGKQGIAILIAVYRPRALGTFVRAKVEENYTLFQFTDGTILFSSILAMITLVGEKMKDGSYESKGVCHEFYIGGKTLSEIVLNIVT